MTSSDKLLWNVQLFLYTKYVYPITGRTFLIFMEQVCILLT